MMPKKNGRTSSNMELSAAIGPAESRRHRVLMIAESALALAAAWLFLRSAWLSDDAFISLRQVEMFVTGHGMVWNLGHRVQAFTHPAWFVLLSVGRALTGSLYYMTIAVSAACVAGTLWIYWRACRATDHLPAVTVMLMALPLLSVAFRDYMTSGLENPLSFLLVAVVFALLPKVDEARARRLVWIVLALAVLNRQDLALQLGPLALWLLLRRDPLRELVLAVPGILLLLLWFGFATLYFGSPLPNTFYAKMSSGLPAEFIHDLGARYFIINAFSHPFTSAVIFVGTVAGLAGGPANRLIAVGILLHLVDLYRIGGDFMQGRVLSVDFLFACFLLVRAWPGGRRLHVASLGAVCAIGLILEPSYLVRTRLEPGSFVYVTDERQFYYHSYGMLSESRVWPVRQAGEGGGRVRHVAMSCGFIGAARIRWPDTIYLIDSCGLTDPFLARMPVALRDLPDMRTGHFFRTVPANIADVILGEDRWLPDRSSRPLWADIELITTAPLFDRDRLAAVWRLSTGAHAFDRSVWAHPETAEYEVITHGKWLTGQPQQPYSIYPSEAHRLLMEKMLSQSRGS
ncbi:MAG: hypothetical protein ACE5FS_04620 [Paracoccaceae bacterium]